MIRHQPRSGSIRSNAQHQQAFVSVSDGTQGLLIANKGLNEYEVLRDGENTIAVTLLRSVSELGDWGVFPTPEAQCLGDHTVEFAIYPHVGTAIQSGAFASAYQFQSPWFHTLTMGQQVGSLQTTYQALEWRGPSLALSAFKMSLDHDDVIVRLYNLAHEAAQVSLKPSFSVASAYQSDILERRHDSAELADGLIRSTAGKCEIITYAFQHKQS